MLAFLVGTVTKENDQVVGIQVEELFYPKVEKGYDYVKWNPQDVVKLQAQILPRAIVGTLHSHPHSEPHLSREDVATAEQFGEIISGVYSYWIRNGRRQTSLDWYIGCRLVAGRVV